MLSIKSFLFYTRDKLLLISFSYLFGHMVS